MVYIKRMIVKNFKSFGGDPIKLNFQPGFNIITGPNGSGKSNILDAVQFVLGELGSKRMRAPDLAGLIYDGAGEDHEGRAQVAMVSLYFDNEDRGLPVDRSTVSIGRKLDREGKSDYYLNGKKTSRRQMVEVLEMVGVTPGGYNIVLQGTATRLSDLTSQERMAALEDLVGITEYDQKKADAKVKLTEAERKIEVAQAQIGEIRKKVNELELQRNNALLHGLLEKEESYLGAARLSDQLDKLEARLGEHSTQIGVHEAEAKGLEEERERLIAERDEARRRLDEFNKMAAERGNTRLPMLRSDLVAKNTLSESLNGRLRGTRQRRAALIASAAEKQQEIERNRQEIGTRNVRLAELGGSEEALKRDLEAKQAQLQALNEGILRARETAEQNQRLAEELTEGLVPMQESLSGVETEINRHLVAVEAVRVRVGGLREKEQGYLERREGLLKSIGDYDALKAEEAKKLEDMIQTVEDQIQRQRSIRSTIEGANQLAKEAETTITELTAKRDLWQHVVTEEKALERIREIGEAGAMDGYHGPLRSLIKIDLPLQRAVESSAEGWINAVVVDDLDTAKEHVERLKKTKLGVTRFIPLDQLREPEEPPELKVKGVVGHVPSLIRYDELYAPAVHLLWGDTYLVEDSDAAERVAAEGHRAVTRAGDVFEPSGGVIGGFFRRPPDWSKLIPSEESISNLSTTIKDLRGKLKDRMKELRDSGFDLRKFTQYMEDSQEHVKRIDEEMKSAQESIERLDYNLGQLRETIAKAEAEIESEDRLRQALEERRQRTLAQMEESKARIAELRGVRLSDVASMELERNALSHEMGLLDRQLSELQNDRSIQGGFVERILALKISEAQQDMQRASEEAASLDSEEAQVVAQLVEVEAGAAELQRVLGEVTSEVEATSKVYEQHQRTLRQLDAQAEVLARRRAEAERRAGQVTLDREKVKLQAEQRLEELARMGFSDRVDVGGMDPEQVERRLAQIRQEKRSLGAINQLAVEHYGVTMLEYKQRSIRINGMEEEKQSILRFIEEVEREKQEHFMTAYNQIGENFSAIFSKLTGGGDGRLELQKPEDPFSGGVDLYIQFPGKPMRLASGASGGERSVAAIAYLLAIQRFLKAPFYLFDEIDAHLDDLNTSRLSEVLKESAADSQFMMISLKDVMVHNADRIYGVFAQNGRSRVLALPMREARVAA